MPKGYYRLKKESLNLGYNKLMDFGEESQEKVKSRFLREAKAYAKCKHSNIVSIYDIGDSESFPYFIMEYIEEIKKQINFYLILFERLK